jgi:hypothetical protein
MSNKLVVSVKAQAEAEVLAKNSIFQTSLYQVSSITSSFMISISLKFLSTTQATNSKTLL